VVLTATVEGHAGDVVLRFGTGGCPGAIAVMPANRQLIITVRIPTVTEVTVPATAITTAATANGIGHSKGILRRVLQERYILVSIPQKGAR
jgi:hypothetical protein